MHKGLNVYNNKISAVVYDALSNITSVVILGVKTRVLHNVRKTMKSPMDLHSRITVVNELKWMTGDYLFHSLKFIPIFFYILFVLKDGRVVQIGTITAMYMYLASLSEVFFSFAGDYQQIMKRKADIENAESIEKDFVKSIIRKKKLGKWSELKIEKLNFSYEDMQNNLHLNNIKIKIKKGERIAFIGESGSGKTTFLKVLHGLYPNTSATISSENGEPLATSFADLDLKTMLVPQEPEIFSSTIRENITLGVNYEEKEIRKVLRLARFDDVVKGLPKQLESVINEKGVNLSGGQKQRLALARALLFAKDKEIILLDESTSSVDPENEIEIYNNIFNHFKGRTVLASIHKMNLLKYFDRIVIFNSGKITNEGTFDDLLVNDETFAKSWSEYVKSHKA